MATVMPISDRRARLAFILAVLGVPSLGITVPAAIWLGVGAVRGRRLSSGAEPAMGFIALVIAGLLLVARAGLVGAMAGGTALFVRLIAVLD